MKKLSILLLFFFVTFQSFALKKRVLFLGNSYTYVNDLPKMLYDAAASTNDTVVYDSYTVGGYTLKQHSTDANTLNKIMIGNWDYVVLQDQSQTPALSDNYVQANFFPYTKILDSLIRHYNPCAETVFYMTWGYKNGDANNCPFVPPVCTYSGMDSMLRSRYMMAADSNDAIVSPVGPVRRYIRNNYPAIELYDTDGSHPSVAGTYAAACSFYSIIFRKSALNITFNSTLTVAQASNIRTAAKAVAFDSLTTWHVGEYDPKANFTFTKTGNTFAFTNTSTLATQYTWHFGDGNTSTLPNPSHTYTNAGNYTVKLIAKNCSLLDSSTKTVSTSATGVSEVYSDEIILYPNPVKDILTIQMPVYLLQHIFITSIDGKKITVNYTSGDREISMDLSKLSSGIYFLNMHVDGHDVIKKIVKQ